MAKRKRFTLKQLSTCVPPKVYGELSDMSWALNRPVSEIIREMVESDMPRFKDRHRKAISEGRKSAAADEASDSTGL